MKRTEKTAIPLYDYRTALQGAMSWLGDRYLLAEPAQRLPQESKPYFAEQQRRWHPVVVAGAIAKARR